MESLVPSTKCKHKACSDPDLTEVQSVACEAHASSNRCFEQLLLDAVDEGLAGLGDSARRTIYYHLEKDFNIRRQDIPCKIEEFADAIEKIFGVAAALLEIQIMKKLHEKVGTSFRYSLEQKDLVFTEYIKTVKLLNLNKFI